MNITKLEGAQRQLDCAIRLFFDDEDSLSIHTLAYAAFRVLFDLYPRKISDGFEAHLTQTAEAIGWKISRVPNFLKHADYDPDGVLLNHVPEEVEPTIGLAAILHHRIVGRMTPEMRAFDVWIHGLYPKHFKVPPDPDPVFEEAYHKSVALIRSGPRAVRLSLGGGLIAFFREHPDHPGGPGAPRDPEVDVT